MNAHGATWQCTRGYRYGTVTWRSISDSIDVVGWHHDDHLLRTTSKGDYVYGATAH